MKKLLLLGLFWVTTVYAVDCPVPPNVELKQSIKWYRDSAEQKASYNQAFNMGSQFVANWFKSNKPKVKTWGVILDIDETTLDNSWYFKKCTDNSQDENNFSHYVVLPQKSVALPGVVKFTCEVKKQGGYVSLVSNRDGSYVDASGNVLHATINNLKHVGVCFDQVVLANRKDSATPDDKNPRFQAINSGKYDAKQMVWSNQLPAHKVIAYFGNNIQDFPQLKQDKVNNLSGTAKQFDIFGNGYFILPNPVYGSWENNKFN